MDARLEVVLNGQGSTLHSQKRVTDLSACRCSGLLHPLGMRCDQMRGAADVAAAAVMRGRLAATLCMLPASPIWHPAERALPARSLCVLCTTYALQACPMLTG